MKHDSILAATALLKFEKWMISIRASTFTLSSKSMEYIKIILLIGHSIPLLFRNGRYEDVNCKSTELLPQKVV